MKQFLFIAHTIFIFFGCTSPSEKKASHSGKLNFEPVTIQSKILSGKAQLEANPEQQKLLLNIKLTNNTDEAVPVESINIETAEGYQAKLISPELKSFTLSAGTDTMITLQFKPVNNFELYMLTGESGKFKPLYNFSVVYKDDKNENLIKAQFNVLNEDFAEYEKNYRQTVVAYKFNCENSFAEKQKKYLQSLLNTPSFVYISNQEIAVAGLNFRLQSYRQDDSLFAEVFIVNHADFSIRIAPNALDILNKNFAINDKGKNVQFKKITGQQEDANILRKGDRAIISMSKYLKDTTGNRLSICFKNTFLMLNGRYLFYENPGLETL